MAEDEGEVGGEGVERGDVGGDAERGDVERGEGKGEGDGDTVVVVVVMADNISSRPSFHTSFASSWASSWAFSRCARRRRDRVRCDECRDERR